MTPRTVLLLGPDHPRLGARAAAVAGPGAAVALSAGARSPGYRVEPNEDAALAAAGPGATVLAVADGHGGAAAATAAIAAIAAALTAVAPAGPPATAEAGPSAGASGGGGSAAGARADALFAVGRAAAERARLADPRGPRCALSVAVLAGGLLAARTFGDTAVVVVGPDAPRVVSGVAPGLGGAAPVPPPLAVPVAPGDRVVLVTDGVYDALGAAWPPTLHTCATADATACATGLLSAALAAGAADNLAIACAGPR